jgi:hypothetical protein
MAGLLPDQVRPEPKPFVGYQLLNIITAGMYDDPLMVYREYVQNAVDSIDVALEKGTVFGGQEEITIQINGNDRTVRIEDNGLGIPTSSAMSTLLDLGFSPKDGAGQRGFRGIGRLGGLAYCDLLRFTTRAASEDRVTIVEWDRRLLDGLSERSRSKKSLTQMVQRITKVCDREASPDEPSHFFRVEMIGVRRFHSDKLMNVKAARDYLSQVSPVPCDHSMFSYTERLDEFFSDVPGYRSYKVTVNGKSVMRPYSDKIQVNANTEDLVKDINVFEFLGIDKPLAKGWYAEIDYRGALPVGVAMRGIRVRQGNIQVGDEYFLAPYYLERRFATWVVGEIQVCDYNIRPNARRDGFEHTTEYESFLEQASVLGRLLSQQCRKSSKERSNSQTVMRQLDEVESRVDSLAFFIDEEHRNGMLSASLQKLEQVRRFVNSVNDGEAIKERYGKVSLKVSELPERKAFFYDLLDRENICNTDGISIIGRILKTLQKEYHQCKSIEDLMQRVVRPFLKTAMNK